MRTQVKITNPKLKHITEGFLQVAITNDFPYIGVGDRELSEKYRLKGVTQIRYCKEYLAFAYDTLGNKTVVTLDGRILQF